MNCVAEPSYVAHMDDWFAQQQRIRKNAGKGTMNKEDQANAILEKLLARLEVANAENRSLRAELAKEKQRILFDQDAAEKLSRCGAEVEVLKAELATNKAAREWLEAEAMAAFDILQCIDKYGEEITDNLEELQDEHFDQIAQILRRAINKSAGIMSAYRLRALIQ